MSNPRFGHSANPIEDFPMPRDRDEVKESGQEVTSEEPDNLPDPLPGERIEAKFRVTIDGRTFSTANVSRVGLFVEGLTSPGSLRGTDPRLAVEIEIPTFGRFRLSCIAVHVIEEERARLEGIRPGTGLLVLSAEEPYYELMDFHLKASRIEDLEKGLGSAKAQSRLNEYHKLSGDLRPLARSGGESGALLGETHTLHSKLRPFQPGETGFRLITDKTKIDH